MIKLSRTNNFAIQLLTIIKLCATIARFVLQRFNGQEVTISGRRVHDDSEKKR